MAAATEKASSRRKARGFISPSCMAYSLLPDGTSAGERHGEVSGEFISHAVLSGIDMVDAVRDIALKIGMKEPKLVQATSAYLLSQKK